MSKGHFHAFAGVRGQGADLWIVRNEVVKKDRGNAGLLHLRDPGVLRGDAHEHGPAVFFLQHPGIIVVFLLKVLCQGQNGYAPVLPEAGLLKAQDDLIAEGARILIIHVFDKDRDPTPVFFYGLPVLISQLHRRVQNGPAHGIADVGASVEPLGDGAEGDSQFFRYILHRCHKNTLPGARRLPAGP